MSTFFFADLIPGMLLTPFKVLENALDDLLSFQFFVSDTFFDAFAHFFQSLFLFCSSPVSPAVTTATIDVVSVDVLAISFDSA